MLLNSKIINFSLLFDHICSYQGMCMLNRYNWEPKRNYMDIALAILTGLGMHGCILNYCVIVEIITRLPIYKHGGVGFETIKHKSIQCQGSWDLQITSQVL